MFSWVVALLLPHLLLGSVPLTVRTSLIPRRTQVALTQKQIDKKLAAMPEGRTKDAVAERLAIQVDIAGDLHEAGKSTKDIAETLGVSPVRATVLVYHATAEPVDPTPKNVVKLRKEGKAWGYIAAATGLTEPGVKAMYTEATGEDHSTTSIGKGGRKPGGATEAKAPAKAKTKASKAAPKSKAKNGTKSKAAPKKSAVRKRRPAASAKDA